jgi:hypothetical protein
MTISGGKFDLKGGCVTLTGTSIKLG